MGRYTFSSSACRIRSSGASVNTTWSLLALAVLLVSSIKVIAAPKLLVDNGNFRPDNFVRQIAIDRSDNFLLVSDFSTGVAFYDLAKGSLVNRFVGHSLAGDVSYQAALDRLVTTGDGTLKIWDVSGQRLKQTIKQSFHSQFMNGVYLEPSGRFAFAENVKYQLSSGKALRRLPDDNETRTFFRADRYVTVDAKGRGRIFSTSDDNQLASFLVHLPGEPASIHFDENRGELYFGYTDGFVVYDVERRVQGRVAFERSKVYSNYSNLSDSCVTADGRFLVSVSEQDQQLVVLERVDSAKSSFIDNAKEVYRTTLISSDLACLRTRPQVVVSMTKAQGLDMAPESTETTLMLFDVPSRQVVWRIGPRLFEMGTIAINRAGDAVATQVGADVHQIVARNGVDNPNDVSRFFIRSPAISWEFRFRPDVRREELPERLRALWDRRTRWFSVGLDGDLRPREISEQVFTTEFVHRSGTPDMVLPDQSGRPIRSPSGRFDALPASGFAFRIVEHLENRTLDLFSARDSGVTYSVAFSTDEQMLAFGGSGRQVTVQALPDGRVIRRLWAPSYVEALAFSPNNRELAVGTLKNEIWVYDLGTGAVVRKITGFDGSCIDLAISGDGRLLISTSSDGGLRFWDFRTGKLLVTSYFDRDLRFAAVTPAGYFDRSSQFDQLLWNVDGVPASFDQYYETFYRPLLVRAALQGKVDGSLPSTGSVGLPPLVRIVELPETTGESHVMVKVGISDRGGGVGSVRIYANGTAVQLQQDRGVSVVRTATEVVQSFEVPLSAGRNELRIIAFNAGDTVQSVPAERVVTAKYNKTGVISLHAVVIGIQEYQNPDLNLKFPRSDAELFAKTLSNVASGLYAAPKVTLLTRPEQTTRDNIERVLASLQNIDPNDLFVFYVASHGMVDNGRFYLLTSNVGSVASRHLAEQALSQELLSSLIMRIPAQKKLAVIDTCSAAALGDALQLAALGRGLTEATAIKVLSRAVGTTVLSASSAAQQALEGYQGHGLFTFVVTKGLLGGADLNHDTFVKTTELADFVDDEVPQLAEKVFGHKQFPTVAPQGQAFPIGRINSTQSH